MKSKSEKKLDEEFEKLGIKPRVYHFVGAKQHYTPFRAITVVTANNLLSWKTLDNIVRK